MDLRNLLEQDRLQVMDLLDVSRKLILDVRASHFWTLQGLETCQQLASIGTNLNKMLDALQPYWEEGSGIFTREEAAKLWKTGAGLYRALPPIRAKFADQLDKRRRQRIMGETFDEIADVAQEDIDGDRSRFTVEHLELRHVFEALQARIAAIPEKLVPMQTAAPTANPAANGQAVPAKDGAPVADIASPNAATTPSPGSPAAGETPPASAG
jgi:hypothetical protein